MAVGTVNIDVDANIARLVTSMNQANAHLGNLERQANNARKALVDMAIGAVGIYSINQAFESVVVSGLKANKAMEDSEGKLWAMIAASRAYVDVNGKVVSSQERKRLLAIETTETMKLLTIANSETAMGMTELMDVYALMKPGMDRNKVSIEDQIAILKMVTNTASNFSVGADELANGIDDLADGTWKSASGFGKMMKSLSITQDEVKNTTNILELLRAKMADTGSASDNMDTAVSNLNVEWDKLTKTLTKNAFDSARASIKDLTDLLKTDGIAETIAHISKSLAALGISILVLPKAIALFKSLRLSMLAIMPTIRGVNITMAMNGQVTTLAGTAASLAATKIKALGIAIKGVALSAAPLAALMAVFETWLYLSGEIAKEEEKLTKILKLKGDELNKLKLVQNEDNLNKLQGKLRLQREILSETQFELRLMGRKVGKHDEEYVALAAIFEEQKKTKNELTTQIKLVESVIDGTYEASNASLAFKDNTADVTTELIKASAQANILSSALRTAAASLGVAMSKHAVLMGQISQATATAKNDTNSINNSRKDLIGIETTLVKLGKQYNDVSDDKKRAEVSKEIAKTEIRYLKAQENLQKNINTEIVHGNENATSALNIARDKKILAIELANVNKTDSVAQARTALKVAQAQADFITMQTFIGNTAANSIESDKQSLNITKAKLVVKKAEQAVIAATAAAAEQSSKRGAAASKKAASAAKKAAKAQKKANDEAKREAERQAREIERIAEASANRYSNIFSNMFNSLLDGNLLDSFRNMFDSIGSDMMKPMFDELGKSASEAMSSITEDMSSAASFLTGGLLSVGGSIVTSLIDGFLNTVEEAPILGTLSEGSDSLINAMETTNKVMYENLSYTKRMTASLSSIDKAFGGLGNELSGLDLSASGFRGSQSSSFLGFSSSSKELQGTSLNISAKSINELVNGQAEATADVVTKVTKSSFFGLSSSVSYDTKTTDVSNSVNEYLADVTKNIVDTFNVAGDILSVELTDLANQTINIGKLDTSGKSGEDIANQIQGLTSEQADKIAKSYFPIVEQFVQASEDYMGALVRTSLNFEQIGYQIGQMGEKVTFETSQAIVGVFGSLSEAQSGLASYVDIFYSDQEKLKIQLEDLRPVFDDMRENVPKTKEEFRNLVEMLDTTTKEGAKTYAELIKLAPEFDTMIQLNDSLKEAELERLEEITEAEKEVLEATEARIKAYQEGLVTEANLKTQAFKDEATLIANKHSLELEAKKAEIALIEDSIARYDDLRQQSIATIELIKAERIGDLSYLSTLEKSQIADVGSRASVELALQSTSSKSEFIPIFEKYISELEKEIVDASNTDLLEELRVITSKLEDLESTTRDGLYN